MQIFIEEWDWKQKLNFTKRPKIKNNNQKNEYQIWKKKWGQLKMLGWGVKNKLQKDPKEKLIIKRIRIKFKIVIKWKDKFELWIVQHEFQLEERKKREEKKKGLSAT